MWDRTKMKFKETSHLRTLILSAPPGGGRNILTQRFSIHFHVFNMPKPNPESLFVIFNSILSGFINKNFHAE